VGSFRQAILDSNAAPSATNTIDFDIPGQGVQTLAPASPLPPITSLVLIDATTQPGFAGTPLITLSGPAAGSTGALAISGGNVTIRGLAVDRIAIDPTTDGPLIAEVHAPGLRTDFSLLDSQGSVLVRSDGLSPANRDDLIDEHLRAGTYSLQLDSIGGQGAYTFTTIRILFPAPIVLLAAGLVIQPAAPVVGLSGSALDLIAPIFTVAAIPGGMESQAREPRGVALLASFEPGARLGTTLGQAPSPGAGAAEGEASAEPRAPDEAAAASPAEVQVIPPWSRQAMGLDGVWERVRAKLLEKEGPVELDGPQRRPAPPARGPDAVEPSRPQAADLIDVAVRDLAGEGEGLVWRADLRAGPGALKLNRLARPLGVAAATAASSVIVAWAARRLRPDDPATHKGVTPRNGKNRTLSPDAVSEPAS
jgi:hypothetical protein